MFGWTPSGTWGVCGVTGTHRGQGHRRSAPRGRRPCTQEEWARAGAPGRGLKARPPGTSRGCTRPVEPPGDRRGGGRAGAARPPPPWPPARGHRRQGGARTSHVLTKPAPAPAQLRGGNALSHSYERSSLLEGRSRTQNHTTPGLGAPAGVGRGASAAWGSTTGPAHPRGPTKDTERERTVGRAEAGDFSPSPCHGCTWWRTVLFPGLGNPSAPRWFWKQLPLQPPSRETLPIRGAESGPGHPHRPRVSNMTPSAPTTQALWHQGKQLLPLPVRG